MNMQRMTVSIPKYLYKDLVRQLPPRKISDFAARVLEKGLLELEIDPTEEFIQLRERLPKIQKAKILRVIKKGRT